MDERERRIGRNEELFRAVNERMSGVNETFSAVSGVVEIVCECRDLGCAELISMRPAEYERLRSDPTWFAVIPGHEVASIERVIATGGGYNIVEKAPGGSGNESSG